MHLWGGSLDSQNGFSTHKSRLKDRKRRLLIEALDARCLLAGDFGVADSGISSAVKPDVNRDGIVSPVDVLQVINVLSAYQLDSHATVSRAWLDKNPLTDADQDGEITAKDFDIVFNSLGQQADSRTGTLINPAMDLDAFGGASSMGAINPIASGSTSGRMGSSFSDGSSLAAGSLSGSADGALNTGGSSGGSLNGSADGALNTGGSSGGSSGTLDCMSVEDAFSEGCDWEPPQLGSIGDFAWYDKDGDGLQDGDEDGLSGVHVQLAEWQGNQWIPYADTFTDADGQYHFEDLNPGGYQVSFIAPIDFAFSPRGAGYDDTIDSDAPQYTLFLNEGDARKDIDAGFIQSFSADIDTDSDNSGRLERSIQEDSLELEAPGNIVLLNRDDDNADGIPDYENQFDPNQDFLSFPDDDLEEVSLSFGSSTTNLDGYGLELSAADASSIEVYGSPMKHYVGTRFTIGSDDVPSSVWVEGVEAGVATLTWTLFRPDGGPVASDAVLLTVVDGDLSAHRQQTPVFRDYIIPPDVEDVEAIGIRINGDDDDGDGVADGMQRTAVPGEDDLMQLDTVVLSGGPGVEWVIERSNTNVSIWGSPDRTDPILETRLGHPSNEAPPNDALIFNDDNVSRQSPQLWVESPKLPGGVSTISIYARAANTGMGRVVADTVSYKPFESIAITWMGELAVPNDPADQNDDGNKDGIMEWAIDQYHDGYDIYAFDESDYYDWEFDCLEPSYEEIKSAINLRGVTDVALMGYSHGGGVAYHMGWHLTATESTYRDTDGSIIRVPREPAPGIEKPFEIVFTGYIDAVRQDGWWPTSWQAETRLPPGSQYHINQYQNLFALPTFWIGGAPTVNQTETPAIIHNIDRTDLGATHRWIDDEQIVLDCLEEHFQKQVNK